MTPQDIQNLLRLKTPHYKFNPRIALAFFLATFSALLALTNADKNNSQSGYIGNCKFPFLCNDTYYLVIMNALICSNITEVIQQISASGFNSSLTGEPVAKIFYQLINHTQNVNLYRDVTKLPQQITENGLMQLFLNISNHYFSTMDSTVSNLVMGLIVGAYASLLLIAVGIGIHSHRQKTLAQAAAAAPAIEPIAPAIEPIAPEQNPAPAQHNDAGSERDVEMHRIS